MSTTTNTQSFPSPSLDHRKQRYHYNTTTEQEHGDDKSNGKERGFSDAGNINSENNDKSTKSLRNKLQHIQRFVNNSFTEFQDKTNSEPETKNEIDAAIAEIDILFNDALKSVPSLHKEDLIRDLGQEDTRMVLQYRNAVGELQAKIKSLERELDTRKMEQMMLSGKVERRDQVIKDIRVTLLKEVVALREQLYRKDAYGPAYEAEMISLFDMLSVVGDGSKEASDYTKDIEERLRQHYEAENARSEIQYKRALSEKDKEIEKHLQKAEKDAEEEKENMKKAASEVNREWEARVDELERSWRQEREKMKEELDQRNEDIQLLKEQLFSKERQAEDSERILEDKGLEETSLKSQIKELQQKIINKDKNYLQELDSVSSEKDKEIAQLKTDMGQKIQQLEQQLDEEKKFHQDLSERYHQWETDTIPLRREESSKTDKASPDNQDDYPDGERYQEMEKKLKEEISEKYSKEVEELKEQISHFEEKEEKREKNMAKQEKKLQKEISKMKPRLERGDTELMRFLYERLMEFRMSSEDPLPSIPDQETAGDTPTEASNTHFFITEGQIPEQEPQQNRGNKKKKKKRNRRSAERGPSATDDWDSIRNKTKGSSGNDYLLHGVAKEESEGNGDDPSNVKGGEKEEPIHGNIPVQATPDQEHSTAGNNLNTSEEWNEEDRDDKTSEEQGIFADSEQPEEPSAGNNSEYRPSPEIVLPSAKDVRLQYNKNHPHEKEQDSSATESEGLPKPSVMDGSDAGDQFHEMEEREGADHSETESNRNGNEQFSDMIPVSEERPHSSAEVQHHLATETDPQDDEVVDELMAALRRVNNQDSSSVLEENAKRVWQESSNENTVPDKTTYPPRRSTSSLPSIDPKHTKYQKQRGNGSIPEVNNGRWGSFKRKGSFPGIARRTSTSRMAAMFLDESDYENTNLHVKGSCMSDQPGKLNQSENNTRSNTSFFPRQDKQTGSGGVEKGSVNSIPAFRPKALPSHLLKSKRSKIKKAKENEKSESKNYSDKQEGKDKKETDQFLEHEEEEEDEIQTPTLERNHSLRSSSSLAKFDGNDKRKSK